MNERSHRSGGNFTEPRVELRTHAISYGVVFGWDRQPQRFETAFEAEQHLLALMRGELESVPDPDNWLDEPIELWLR